VFYRFDQLLLLKRGGEVVYFGSVKDRAKPMVRYFEAATQTSLPPQINPANWMLDVIGTKNNMILLPLPMVLCNCMRPSLSRTVAQAKTAWTLANCINVLLCEGW
jgi:hypothetical protein